jgi:NMD protein affecting ribosome stability and mRNA decay
MYFCVKCGKEIENGVFCSEHAEKNDVLDKELNLKACPTGRYFFNHKWTQYESPEAFLKAVYKKKFKVLINPLLLKETSKKLVYDVSGHEVVIKIEKSDAAALKHSQYFEGIIQFRYEKELASRVEEVLKKQKEFWSKKDVFVSKESKQKDGIDWWVTSKKAISIFADVLNKKFGARVSKNAKLFSRNRQTSKDIFRLNVLVEFPKFQEGSVVKVGEKVAKVVQLRRMIKAIDIKTGKSFGFKLNEEVQVLKSNKTRVGSIRPEFTVLHPDTFQEVTVANLKLSKDLKAGEKIKVLLYEGKIWIIP